MAFASYTERAQGELARLATWGIFWLLVAIIGAGVFFFDGIEALIFVSMYSRTSRRQIEARLGTTALGEKA